jgi:osomolarity two-component system, response regulator SKN7
MDDVLPKPFTRKSLLELLEKHLSHLKKPHPGMEPPPSATTSSVPLSSTGQSIKDDASSPAQSPAGSIANWHSPVQYSGMSPIHTNITNQYAQMPNHSPYSTSPHTPLTAGMPGVQQLQQCPPPPPQQQQQQQQQHRRQISEMSGGPTDMNGYSKRARVYGQPAQEMGIPGGPR